MEKGLELGVSPSYASTTDNLLYILLGGISDFDRLVSVVERGSQIQGFGELLVVFDPERGIG
jgi:hypothetical protein